MMGQHKYNPTAQAAKEGKLPPKPKKMSKIMRERELYHVISERLALIYIRQLTGGKY